VAVAIRRGSDWSDLVFHVLSHVELLGSPADLYNAHYVRWAAQQLGDGAGRALQQDAQLLRRLLASREAAYGVQRLAVAFDDVAHAMRCAERSLPGRLAAQSAAGFLRDSALLEGAAHVALPELAPDLPGLHAALSQLMPAAPRLASCELVLCRALTCHGRLFGRRVFVGLACPELRVEPLAVAFQAAHEATVLEVGEAAEAQRLQLAERAVEAAAVVLLASRGARLGLSSEHAGWAAQWGVTEAHCQLAGLHEPARGLVNDLDRRSG